MLYGLETVSLRKRQESELEVAELKMLSLYSGHGEPVRQVSLGIKAGYTQDRVPTHRIHTHYGQFGDANQPTTHVFGFGEETGVPGETERTCKLHTHGRGGNRTPNPGGVRQKC
ncbi:hypothetical protein QTP86_011491 [Hemibagrus guttatus]|nr:hypothetical protein QTP86_011491 [Hemibagrus guttatus]